MMHTGQRIKELRDAKGMTQEALGEKIGVTKATINKYETGIITNLKRATIADLSRALDVSPAYLMGWTNNIDIKENNGMIGSNSGTVNITNGAERALSPEELELLRIYNSLPVKRRIELLSTAIALEENGDTNK